MRTTKPSALIDTRVIYCGDNLEQLAKLPDACVDLIYIDPPSKQFSQKDKAGRPDIDSFEAMMAREDRRKGFFVSFDYTQDAMREVGAFFRKSGRVIIPLTVREILDEEIARKLA